MTSGHQEWTQYHGKGIRRSRSVSFNPRIKRHCPPEGCRHQRHSYVIQRVRLDRLQEI